MFDPSISEVFMLRIFLDDETNLELFFPLSVE